MDCKRCWNCCNGVGENFWRWAYDHNQYPNEILKLLADRTPVDRLDHVGPCDMLVYTKSEYGDTAVCLIEKYFGRDAKPEVCRDHQGDDRCES